MSISELYKAIRPVGPVQPETKHSPQGVGGNPTEFKTLLDEKLQLSQHAATRIQSRNLPWNAEIEKRISQGIETAQAKGSRSALILDEQIAVIANVQSKTIVTAMDRAQLKDRIFTNIDSAVLV